MAKIKHIALTTHDLEQVASFYRDVFGMAASTSTSAMVT
jgi:predicted enzyme related to lactoylglutathione lyase